MAEAAKKRYGRAGLKNDVDFGGCELEGGALYLFNGFGESVDGDVVQERAGFHQTHALGRGAAPFFAADGFGRRGNTADLCAPTVHVYDGTRTILPTERRDSISRCASAASAREKVYDLDVELPASIHLNKSPARQATSA